MGRLDNVLRISVSLPPFEIYCLFQEDNFFLNLSSIDSQRATFLVLVPKGSTFASLLQTHSETGK